MKITIHFFQGLDNADNRQILYSVSYNSEVNDINQLSDDDLYTLVEDGRKTLNENVEEDFSEHRWVWQVDYDGGPEVIARRENPFQ